MLLGALTRRKLFYQPDVLDPQSQSFAIENYS